VDLGALESKINAYHALLDPYVQAEQAPYTQLLNYQAFADSVYAGQYALVPYLADRVATVEAAL
jgi:hypothetical protein